MIQAVAKSLTFQAFLEWYPENGRRYELMNGEIREMRPIGDHEELSGLITCKLDREIERLGSGWFIPKTCCTKTASDIDAYIPDLVVLDRHQLLTEPLWKTASTITQGRSARLVVEVVSTNWRDDYAKKLEDYEELGIPEYWIVDYRALGGRRYIGSPKRPTIAVYSLVNGIYEGQQFRGPEAIESRIFPDLKLRAEQILEVGE